MDNKENIKKYDITILTEKETGENLSSIIEKNEGKMVTSSLNEKLTLAYPIKKNDFAFLSTFVFESSSEGVEALKNDLKFNDDILRYMLLKVDDKQDTIKARTKTKKRFETSEERSDNKEVSIGNVSAKKQFSESKKKEAGDSLTNKDLEEKIQELK